MNERQDGVSTLILFPFAPLLETYYLAMRSSELERNHLHFAEKCFSFNS